MIRRLLIAPLLLASCTRAEDHARAVCVLMDESGTYADQRPHVVDIIRRSILPGLLPGDLLVLVGIDSNSFDADNVRASLLLDRRPSRANQQKLGFLEALDAVETETKPSRYTDIRGGFMLCGAHLAEAVAREKTIVVFSDLDERLPRGVRRDLTKSELADIRVVAINVKRLRKDGANPAGYRARIAKWEEIARAGGARDFRIVISPDRLVAYLEEGT